MHGMVNLFMNTVVVQEQIITKALVKEQTKKQKGTTNKTIKITQERVKKTGVVVVVRRNIS